MNYTKLVEKAKTKDEKAIEQLFEMTSQKGYFVALKYLKSEEDARDILQDSYVAAISKLDQLKDPSRFDKWLFQIIANKAKNYLVKNKPLLFEQLESKDEDAIQFEETIKDDRIEFQPKENSDYQELKTALRILIDELPEDQRMCLLMYYFEDLSISEIAESLELNNNTIKSRLNYARTKIKDKIEELKKQGTHLYSISPIPFLLWMLGEEEKATAVPKIASTLLQTQIAQSTSQAVAHKGIVVAGKYISTKAIIASSISVVALLAGGSSLYQYNQEQKEQSIYDKLVVQFSDNNVFEYGTQFDESKLILSHTGNIKLVKQVDMKKVGNQTLIYIASQNGIEREYQVTIEIKDTQNPILELTEETIEITVGDKFDPEIYIKKANDPVEGDLKEKVEIDNLVNSKKVGVYKVNYSLSDSNNLNAKATLTVNVKEKSVINTETTEKRPTEIIDTRQTFQMDKLGMSMKVPENMLYSGEKTNTANAGSYTDENGKIVMKDYVYYTSNYNGSDSSLFGQEGLIVDIRFFPYSTYFTEIEGNQGLRYTIEGYNQRGYDAYDKGNYILAIKQGVDYPLSGSAWTMDNDNESISIRVQSKDDTGVYAINIRVNNYERGFSLGIDGYKDKRIQIARDIFNSIK